MIETVAFINSNGRGVRRIYGTFGYQDCIGNDAEPIVLYPAEYGDMVDINKAVDGQTQAVMVRMQHNAILHLFHPGGGVSENIIRRAGKPVPKSKLGIQWTETS